MSDIVEQLRIAVAVPICKPAADEIESLRQQLKDVTDHYHAALEAEQVRFQQLAAIQAREQQLLEILGEAKPLVLDWCNENGGAGLVVFAAINKAIDQPQDTTALSATVTKAGEVMRERVMQARGKGPLYPADIRALPAITLADIK